jgi:hypothetical protein
VPVGVGAFEGVNELENHAVIVGVVVKLGEPVILGVLLRLAVCDAVSLSEALPVAVIVTV